MSKEIMNSIVGGHVGVGQRYETLSTRDLSGGTYSALDNFNDPTQFGVFDPTKQTYGVGYLPYDTAVSLSLESLEEIARGQEQTYLMMQEQQAILNKLGGVSRAHAETMKEFLPPTIALESFTTNVTKTNYALVQEAMSHGLRLVAAAGIVAVLGGVFYLLFKIGKKEEKKPNRSLAVKASAGYRNAVSQLMAMDKAFASAGVRFDKPASKVIEDALASKLAKDGISQMGMKMYVGHYLALSASGSEFLNTAKSIDDFIRKGVLVNVNEIIKKGEEARVEDLTFPVGKINFAVGQAMERWASANMLPKVDAHDFTAFKEMVSQNLYQTLDEEAIKKALNIGRPDHDNKRLEDLIPENAQHHITEARQLLKKLGEDIEELGKKLEGGKIPAEVVAQLKEDLDASKETIKVMDLAFDIHDSEVSVFNAVARIKGQSVGALYSAMRDREVSSSKEGAQEMYDQALKSNFEAVKVGDVSKKPTDMGQILASSESFNEFMKDGEALVF